MRSTGDHKSHKTSLDLCKNCACFGVACAITLSNVDPAKIYVLVLDRNPKSAHFIGEILHSSGYRVSVTTHQSEAVALGAHLRFVKNFAGLLYFFMEERAACCGR